MLLAAVVHKGELFSHQMPITHLCMQIGRRKYIRMALQVGYKSQWFKDNVQISQTHLRLEVSNLPMFAKLTMFLLATSHDSYSSLARPHNGVLGLLSIC